MRKMLMAAACLLAGLPAWATEEVITSPDKMLSVHVSDAGGRATYEVRYDGRQMVLPSGLGLKTNIGDLTQGLTLTLRRDTLVTTAYQMTRTKTAEVSHPARVTTLSFVNRDGVRMDVEMYVADHDVAYRYLLPRPAADNPKCAIVYGEASAFRFPAQTTTFLSPQITPMTGWERTKPSYEEVYGSDRPLTAPSQFGQGYTFPCLFRVGQDGWVLVSETGVTGEYVGSHLSDYHAETGYTVAYPQEGELNGNGTPWASIALPGATPWRTITVGRTLQPIAETTIPYDVVEPQYEASQTYRPGRYTWSWILWMDESCNYDDQVKFIDVASRMGYEYILVDALWDKQIGYQGIERLAEYARTRGVSLLLWYNSNGFANDAPQGPRGVMQRAISRKKDMAWMKRIGVKGIKVDFFSGDKQQTMQLYEDILSDANDYGLQVIFHGCTLPRGWERMYPNYVASEAALASENVYFDEGSARREAYDLTMHPFGRNAVASFDWGGMLMNRWMSRDNRSRHQRHTSDVFELATAITNQTSVNCVALTPQAMDELPAFELDFLREVPTTWQETRLIDGYPTRYVVMARRSGDKWYVGGINALDRPLTLTLSLPMLAGQTVSYYVDRPLGKGQRWPDSELRTLRIGKDGKAKVTMQPRGGIVLKP